MKEILKRALIERKIEINGEEKYDFFIVDKSILHVRDMLCIIGNIIEEDLKNSMYIANVRVGLFDLNETVVVIKLMDHVLHIYCVAEEGMVNQKCCDKAIQKVRKELLNER